MTKDEAIAVLIDTSEAYLDNLEESIHIAINDEMLTNDELFEQMLRDDVDEWDREDAKRCREIYQAIKLLS